MTNVNMRNLAKMVENNYGSIYNTSGGGKVQYGGVNVNKFLRQILGNRIFDVYLKYLGIKTLTTASLVPFGLLLGKDYIEGMLSQKGGAILSTRIPFVDHPLVGSYLKLAGLSAVNLTANTLIPLGILIVVYDLYSNQQQGGNVKLPGEYFRQQNGGTDYKVNPLEGSNLFCGTGNCSNNMYSSYFKPTSSTVSVDGFPSLNIPPTNNIDTTWSGNLGTPSFSDIPHQTAGGKLKNKNANIKQYYQTNMNKNNRKQIVKGLIKTWSQMGGSKLSNNISQTLNTMAADKRYSNKSIVNMFPKSVLENSF